MVDPSSEWRRGSTSSDALDQLRGAGLGCSTAVRIEDGISSWTYDVDDGRYIARFPRTSWVARGHDRERRLLPALAAHVSFRVPEPLPVGEGFIVYERLPGRALRADDDAAAVRAMVDELQSFPLDAAVALLDGAMQWRERLQRHRATLRESVWPLLSTPEAAAVDAAFDIATDVEPTLVHGDLFPEHVLVDDATGTPIRMIDFEDASVGDPAVDHAGFLHHLGWPPPAPMARRAWAAAVRVDLWDIAHAEDGGAREQHVAALRRRLDQRPPR